MEGGTLTSPPPRFAGPRYQKPNPGSSGQSSYGFNFRAPSMPGQGAMSFDGKKLRTKAVVRKTVDYNSDIVSYVQVC